MLNLRCLLTSFAVDTIEFETTEDGALVTYDQPSGCGCPEQPVFLKDSRVTFAGLDPREEYFPMVSRNETHAFFALPPKACRPNSSPVARLMRPAQQYAIPVRSSQSTTNSPSVRAAPSRSPMPTSKNEDFESDLYDASSAGEFEDEPDLETPSEQSFSQRSASGYMSDSSNVNESASATRFMVGEFAVLSLHALKLLIICDRNAIAHWPMNSISSVAKFVNSRKISLSETSEYLISNLK